MINELMYSFIYTEEKKAQMVLTGDIGYECNGSQFLQELLYLDTLGLSEIEVLINSPGGIVMDGMSIYYGIMATKTKVRTKCIGVAASAAFIVLQAGDEREVCDYSILMLHNPSSGNSKDKSLKNYKKAIEIMIAKSGLSEEEIGKLMDKTTYINGDNEEYLGKFWDKCEKTEKRKIKNEENEEITLVMNNATNLIDEIKKKQTNKKMINKLKETLGLTIENSDEDVMNKVTEMIAEITALKEVKNVETKETVETKDVENKDVENKDVETKETVETKDVENKDVENKVVTVDVTNQILNLILEKLEKLETKKVEPVKNITGVDLTKGIDATPRKTIEEKLYENFLKKNKQ